MTDVVANKLVLHPISLPYSGTRNRLNRDSPLSHDQTKDCRHDSYWTCDMPQIGRCKRQISCNAQFNGRTMTISDLTHHFAVSPVVQYNKPRGANANQRFIASLNRRCTNQHFPASLNRCCTNQRFIASLNGCCTNQRFIASPNGLCTNQRFIASPNGLCTNL